MYLSELFLETAGWDFSYESVSRSLAFCEDEYQKRKGIGISTQELLDFYDVFIEFAKEFEIDKYEILCGIPLRFTKIVFNKSNRMYLIR